MHDYVHEHFKRHPWKPGDYYVVRPPIVCCDGWKVSVQASRAHYCSPKSNLCDYYNQVEIWGPDTDEPEGYVAVDDVNRLIHNHGGTVYEYEQGEG